MKKRKTAEEMLGIGNIVLHFPHGGVGLVVGNHMLNDKENGFENGDKLIVFLKPEEYYIFMALDFCPCGCPRLEGECFVGSMSLSVPVDLSEELKLYRSQIEIKGKQKVGGLRDFVFGFSENQKNILEVAALVQHYKDGGSEKDMPSWMSSFDKDRTKFLFPLLRKAIILP